MNFSTSRRNELLEDTLEYLPGFKEIGSNDQEQLLRHSDFETFTSRHNCFKEVPRYHDTIYSQDGDASHVYFVIDGRVREVNYDGDGGVSVVNLIQNSGWLGINEVIDDDFSVYSTNAEAMKRTEVLKIPSQSFIEIYQNSDALRKIYNQGLLRKISHLIFIQSISNLKVNKRFIQFLKRAVSEYTIEFEEGIYLLDWTQREIGDFIGTSRETVAREMINLSEKGLVKSLKNRGGGVKIDVVKMSNWPDF